MPAIDYHPIELLHEWETRTNRPRSRPDCGEALLERWSAPSGSATLGCPLSTEPDLMIVLTTFARPGYLRRALESGASGYLLKDSPSEKLADALRKASKSQGKNSGS